MTAGKFITGHFQKKPCQERVECAPRPGPPVAGHFYLRLSQVLLNPGHTICFTGPQAEAAFFFFFCLFRVFIGSTCSQSDAGRSAHGITAWPMVICFKKRSTPPESLLVVIPPQSDSLTCTNLSTHSFNVYGHSSQTIPKGYGMGAG